MECLRNSFRAGLILGDRYQTVSPLNHGSFGLVFMARDLQTRQLVAIKCTTKRSAADEACLEIAIDDKSEELFLHSHLGSHPNIVNLLDSFETESHCYIVLEFCQRGDLYEAIRMGHGPLETEHVRQFMTELMDAVEHMHNKGIYHRDIKPENIFLTQSGSIKLGDFGLATTEEWSYETSVGSDRYMSPEQYDSAGAGYSPAQADIWAIGVVLLNVLFSRNPFTTPTESDPLFLDFSRDKQALFDVFPSMSQDTYEVIVQCMNLDPRKRSLAGARDALERLVSFTTLDEALDDFCTTERRVVASANREPLRTPSVQSPTVDNGAFPWAKALHAGPKPIRQLSTINDNESYTEDLFSKSTATKSDWLSGSVQTSSLSSMLDSSFGASMQSLNITMPRFPLRRAPQETTVAGSLPISMIKPRNTQSAMSMVFGRKDTVSKSWSDLWDEEFEEEQEEAKQLETLKEMNSRTWSHDSKLDEFASDDTPRQGQSPVAKSAVINIPTIETTISDDIDGDLVADGFFFHETPAPAKDDHMPKTSYSPPSKHDGLDKWAALGERRRGNGHSAPVKTPECTFKTHRNARDIREPTDGINGHSNGESHTHIPSCVTSNTPHSPVHHHVVNKDKRNHHGAPVGRDRARDCPWNQGREHREPAQVQSSWNWSFNWRNNKEKRVHQDLEREVERVGGWHTRPVHHL